MTTTREYYWLNGSAYCPDCVECDTPAIDHDDPHVQRGPAVLCSCCGATESASGKAIRHGTFGPIVWDLVTGETRVATQRDMDTLPVGDDLTAEEEETIDGE